jgi:hypothetical protein
LEVRVRFGDAARAMQLAVLNQSGGDPEQSFLDGAGAPDPRIHPPVNYHAYAACTRGAFFREAKRIPEGMRAVLVLLRSNLKTALTVVKSLKAQDRIVAISCKESGQHQIAMQLDSAAHVAMFRELCALAHGALSSTPELVQLYRAAGARLTEFIPTPYPVDDERWDFSRPLAERSGIFIGTREWQVPSRNHAAALLRACSLGVPVTVFNHDGRAGRKKLDAIGCASLRVIESRLPYPDYLREMAKCRVVFQLDSSAVPGQVAGDALLCRMPCIGGNGAVDQVAFSHGANLESLLRDDTAWRDAVKASQVRACEALSFSAGAARLGEFFGALAVV